jgi:hypothetical protein
MPNGPKKIWQASPLRQARKAARVARRWYAGSMTDNTDIELSGPFQASDSSGRAHDVKAIRIFDEGYGIIDVYVDFAKPLEAGLYKDGALLRAIVERLRALGYVGPDFGASDPALQERKCIVLEAPEEFAAFAKRKGWKNLAEEFDE